MHSVTQEALPNLAVAANPVARGTYSVSGAECIGASQGYFTVDNNNQPTTQGAVNQKAEKGFYTIDEDEKATTFEAVNQKKATNGHYTVDTSGKAVSSGAVIWTSVDGSRRQMKGSYVPQLWRRVVPVLMAHGGLAAALTKSVCVPRASSLALMLRALAPRLGEGKYTVDAANVATSKSVWRRG